MHELKEEGGGILHVRNKRGRGIDGRVCKKEMGGGVRNIVT